jgi:hypothetical protein
MENTPEKDAKCCENSGSCGCGKGRSCCAGKLALGLLLVLLGGIGGYFMGRGCGYHRMMACPMTMGVTAPAK